MPKSASERMAGLRARQRRAGLKTVTVVVPQDDAVPLAEWAGRRRRAWTGGGPRRRSAPCRSWVRLRAVPCARRIRRLRELVGSRLSASIDARSHMERRLRALVNRWRWTATRRR
jgi:hypothetical protein